MKNARVQMWRNAKYGWLMLMVTINRPTWLEIEKVTIFKSFSVRTQIAVKNVVIAPKHNIVVWINLLFSVNG